MTNEVIAAAPVEETGSPVSWSAILGGAVVTIATSVILLALGAGFDMRVASPWPVWSATEAATTMVGVWLVVVQAVSGAFGGYLTGRLRVRWANVHAHEVHFRDTAHGLLAWAVSTLIGIALAASMQERVGASVVISPEAAAQFALFTGLALLTGAFMAAVAAAIGGLRRDEMHARFVAERR